MYSSQFDGNAAFSGGGFMPSQTTQGPGQFFSPSKNRDAQSLLPLTIKQINNAFQLTDDKPNLIVDGVDVNNVSLVGRVCDKAGGITEITFILDDGTGKIECNKWIQESVDANEMDRIRNGIYVRLHGHIKGFQAKRTLNVSLLGLSPTSMKLPAISLIVYMSIFIIPGYSGVPSQQRMTNALPITPTKGYQATPPNQLSCQYNNRNGQKSVEDMVLDVLHLPANRARDDGVPLEQIARNAQHFGIPSDKLMLAIKNLIEEGAIYEAIGDHYKSIVNG